jgi:hypothetical protein
MAAYELHALLVADAAYRRRVRACLLEEASKPDSVPPWRAVYEDIAMIEDRMVARLVPLHAEKYDPALVEASSGISDGDILAGVQTHWAEIVGVPAAVDTEGA